MKRGAGGLGGSGPTAQLSAEHLSRARRANRPSGALLNILVFYSCWAYICLYSWWAYSRPSL